MRSCEVLTDEVIEEVRRRLASGEFQHRIAADLDINQGRISEINTGKRRLSTEEQLEFDFIEDSA